MEDGKQCWEICFILANPDERSPFVSEITGGKMPIKQASSLKQATSQGFFNTSMEMFHIVLHTENHDNSVRSFLHTSSYLDYWGESPWLFFNSHSTLAWFKETSAQRLTCSEIREAYNDLSKQQLFISLWSCSFYVKFWMQILSSFIWD